MKGEEGLFSEVMGVLREGEVVIQDSKSLLSYAQQLQEAVIGNEILKPPTMLTKKMYKENHTSKGDLRT